jgi:hypothetical protein
MEFTIPIYTGTYDITEIKNELCRRVVLLNEISLNAVSASQATSFADLQAALETMRHDIKTSVRSEVAIMVEKVSILEETMGSGSYSTLQPAVNDPSDPALPRSSRQLPETNVAPRNNTGVNACTIDDIEDMEIMLLEHDIRMTRYRSSATFQVGGFRATTATDTGTNTCTPKMTAVVTYESKRNRRKINLAVFLSFKLFCNRILKFDIEMQQWCSRGGGKPWLGCSVTLFNIRPYDAPIFQACRDWDFRKVRYLIESGQAILYDVNEKLGGLLEVGHFQASRCIAELSRLDTLLTSAKTVFEDNGATHVFHHHTLRQEHEFGGGSRLMGYLLDQGSDPNTFHGSISPSRMPAALQAFRWGYMSTVSTLMAHGADPSCFGSTAATLLEHGHDDRIFPWKIQTLRNMGFSDWNIETEGDNLLYGAC